jgi:hypothetical protein
MKPTISVRTGVEAQNMMTDADRRAVVLRKFYEVRHSSERYWMPDDGSVTGEDEIITTNICRQLDEHGLIDWRASPRGRGGMGRITSHGIDVVEGSARTAIAISIDKRISISGSRHVQVGDGNTQDVRIDAERVVTAINQSDATVTEKEEAKTLFKTLMENPLLSKILGSFAGG